MTESLALDLASKLNIYEQSGDSRSADAQAKSQNFVGSFQQPDAKSPSQHSTPTAVDGASGIKTPFAALRPCLLQILLLPLRA
jgi:hypothetical protein